MSNVVAYSESGVASGASSFGGKKKGGGFNKSFKPGKMGGKSKSHKGSHKGHKGRKGGKTRKSRKLRR
jgi:hypothetical protein